MFFSEETKEREEVSFLFFLFFHLTEDFVCVCVLCRHAGVRHVCVRLFRGFCESSQAACHGALASLAALRGTAPNKKRKNNKTKKEKKHKKEAQEKRASVWTRKERSETTSSSVFLCAPLVACRLCLLFLSSFCFFLFVKFLFFFSSSFRVWWICIGAAAEDCFSGTEGPDLADVSPKEDWPTSDRV